MGCSQYLPVVIEVHLGFRACALPAFCELTAGGLAQVLGQRAPLHVSRVAYGFMRGSVDRSGGEGMQCFFQTVPNYDRDARLDRCRLGAFRGGGTLPRPR